MSNTKLPSDPIVMEQTLVACIRDTLLSVPLIATYCKVEGRERYPDNREDDINISTVPDPANPLSLRMTSIIQIGIPTVSEAMYTDDNNTQLEFVYPITFDLAVTDVWDNPDMPYKSSRALAMAIYLSARKQFKTGPGNTPNRDFGFANCVHEYLQQDVVGTLIDDETGARLHTAEWSLTVKVTGVLN